MERIFCGVEIFSRFFRGGGVMLVFVREEYVSGFLWRFWEVEVESGELGGDRY